MKNHKRIAVRIMDYIEKLLFEITNLDELENIKPLNDKIKTQLGKYQSDIIKGLWGDSEK